MNAHRLVRHAGFTVVEMLIALAILGIIAALALPSFQQMLDNARVRGTADAIMSGLQLARAEAIRRNARVRFVLGAQAAWSVELDADGSVIQARTASEGAGGLTVTATPNAATRVTFNSFGRVVDATPITRILLDASAQTHDLQIDISSGGLLRLCDPDPSIPAGDVRHC